MITLFIASGVSLAFLIFQILFPYTPPKNSDISLIQQNEKKYNRLEAWAILWIFLSVGFICCCVFLFGSQLQKIVFSSDYDYLIKPPDTYWVFSGLILGFGFIRIPMEFVYKLILKGEYNLYAQFTNMKHGFDGEKIWRPMEIVIATAGIIVFFLGLNWFVRIDKNEKIEKIEVNDLLSLKTKTCFFQDISKIKHYDYEYITENDVRKKVEYFAIIMNDGYELNTRIYDFFAATNDKEKFIKGIEKISVKTKIVIEEVTIPGED